MATLRKMFTLCKSTTKTLIRNQLLCNSISNRRLHSTIKLFERNTFRRLDIIGRFNLPRIDWTESVRGGIVSPVRNQGQYNHCWAFQIDAALSSLYALATNLTLVFAPQELIDFDAGSKPGTSSNRNEGGTLVDGFNWVKKNGLSLEADYPYHGVPSSPKVFRRHSRPVFYIDGIGFVPEFEESLLRVAVTFHPISSALQLKDVSVLSDYSKGILRPSPAVELDGEVEGHAVQIVGFDVIDGERVWKLKNSHGEEWGMNGFFYVRRDVEDPSENFYLAQQPVYPILDGVNEDLFAC